jgi:hypothetical protein
MPMPLRLRPRAVGIQSMRVCLAPTPGAAQPACVGAV